MKANEYQTKVGLGVMIIKDGKILIGKRKGSHGAGGYAFPGGHLEYMESFEEGSIREVREECGLEIKNIKVLFISNLRQYAPKHYVHLGLVADWKLGEPRVLEPDKCEGWSWFDIDDLPSKLFSTIKTAIDSYKTGRHYYKEEDLIK